MSKSLFLSLLTWLVLCGANLPVGAALDLSKYTLVDEIDVTQPVPGPDDFLEYPAGISTVEPSLTGRVRVLPNTPDKPGAKYFAYRIGKGKGLKAGEAYLLEVVYPEDAPRSMVIRNSACATNRGFHTGLTLGDALKPPYVNNLPESLNLPLSGQFESWQELFHVHQRWGEKPLDRDNKGPRDGTPASGFLVYVIQFAPEQDPLSKGAAVSRLRLYKAPPYEDFTLKVNLPPADLPRRHLFFREEMADGVIEGERSQRGVEDPAVWYGQKCELMGFLGMNTFAKDLLEFGANQGWDSTKYGGNEWVYQSREPGMWNSLVPVATRYGLDILPYYEYSGSKGAHGLGNEKRAMTLGGEKDYTHISWAENSRADLTDPDTYEDLRKMLEITICDLKDKGKFVGAWLRPRNSGLPVSFSDRALAKYSAAKGLATPATREQLKTDSGTYAKYLAWWNDERKAFFIQIRDYLRANSGNPEAVVLYTFDASEPGRGHPSKQDGVITDDPAAWQGVPGVKTIPLASAITERYHWEALTLPMSTWGKWEWNHSVPPIDPANYQDESGVLPTFTFNRAYTVGDAAALQAFETKSGMAMVRHFSLNEDMLRVDPKKKESDLLGYFVSDFELAGPYCLLAEARAMANGNPTHIGYLSSNSFNRGFPEYVRNFDAAFLALPARPGQLLAGASTDSEVVARQIDGGAHGLYFAVVNTGYRAKQGVAIHLPSGGEVVNAATLEKVPVHDGAITLDLYPCQLVALHQEK